MSRLPLYLQKLYVWFDWSVDGHVDELADAVVRLPG
jgi:hypothetical protein